VKSYPRSRAAGETVRELVARILARDISDPRLEFVTVTGVEMSPDLRHANVFVTAHGDPDQYDIALQGLESAKGRIRTLLGSEMSLRYVPELHFKIDPSVDEAFKIAGMLRTERESGRVHDDADGDEDA
jgi:ribosome-binding factor A